MHDENAGTGGRRRGWWQCGPKRWFDCLAASVGLLVLAPVLGVIALTIRTTHVMPCTAERAATLLGFMSRHVALAERNRR